MVKLVYLVDKNISMTRLSLKVTKMLRDSCA